MAPGGDRVDRRGVGSGPSPTLPDAATSLRGSPTGYQWVVGHDRRAAHERRRGTVPAGS